MADRIDQIDERLADWVTEQVEVSAVSFDPPGGESTEKGVSLFLLELGDAPPPRTPEPAPLQLSLRYLVTTWAETAQQAHRVLGNLVLEAMQATEFEFELSAPGNAFWESVGIPPRPSFFLTIPFRRERPRGASQLVRQPLVLELAQLRPLAGRVVGPGDVPIPGATVELPALNTRTETDRRGQFQFEAVPQQSAPERVVVRAKGTTSETQVDLSSADAPPFTIQIDPEG